MASNPYVTKVQYGNQTLIDLTNDTVTPADVAEGVSFHDRSGARQTGTGNYYSPNDTAEASIADNDYFPFYDTSASGKRKTLWSNIKAKLKTYFDNLYATVNGHTMIPVTNDISQIAGLTNGNDNYVVNAYSTKRWANTDTITLLTTATQDTDTIGDWDDNWEESGASRSGWLWSADLYGVLSDDTIKIDPVHDLSKSEVISLYAYRIDDNISRTINGQTVNGGAVAFKFNNAVKSSTGIKVGLTLKKQRTQLKNFTVLS